MSQLRYPMPASDPATPIGVLYSDLLHRPMEQALLPSGQLTWIVTRYDEVRFVLSDERFSRYLLYPGAPYMVQPGDFSTGDHDMLSFDPPDHTRLRRLASKAFTARRIEALRPRVEEIASELLDVMALLVPPVDVVEHFAFPLPTIVICELLGIPYDQRERFKAWSTTIVAPTVHTPAAVAAARADCGDHLRELVAAKRASPSDDLLTGFIQARDDSDRLSEDELIGLAAQLLLAGHETTVSLLATAVVLFDRFPSQLKALQADPSLAASAVEEIMRYDGPAGTTLLRVATSDVEVGSTLVRKGEAVVAITGAAGFDPTVVADPLRFDIARKGNPQLGFGHGVHFCLGAPLARLEGQVALAQLYGRFPSLRLAVPQSTIAWRPPLSVRGPVGVPVTWD
jgi:cytochrome P450